MVNVHAGVGVVFDSFEAVGDVGVVAVDGPVARHVDVVFVLSGRCAGSLCVTDDVR